MLVKMISYLKIKRKRIQQAQQFLQEERDQLEIMENYQ